MIHTITSVCSDFNSRTWGFYKDINDAINAIHNEGLDLHESRYDYIVIESIEEGIGNIQGEIWFAFSQNKWVELEKKPSDFYNVFNFAMG